ncbi:bifunctional 4-hydroxy-2-oxoglutarate aldolase/2-dehydro-3-deoxy-phosphogluconate aldolase [Mariprofundus sp. KV]|uniref:bifunctional 4-hydroxy-2-oxoglutarate aldolase/2-dehydro-3-deoxy-phosphogluconate aldolase n=1 Tax=Mariprofundus sp. KV TaxID=2608715 RepID=UPI0015A3885B|nr:bifunctional 4-hydroxy-2-oxoglutarate aldolase/2-dehydro-3-deoxy-phosphogluconate aldolase [Mariprofundus sp. KV]NWF35561.1 bifunctional 4-hydroxy-2-oxoglutarate aldolase/2-dehydro-3-deoxy-phosphogluconate aldolase [Mariprofundus sp. KV]
MAVFSKDHVQEQICTQGYVPLFFYSAVDANAQVAKACLEGGSRLIEFTNRGEGALELFASLVDSCRLLSPHLAVGAGSIIDADTAASFIAAGADFIVGPAMCEETLRCCEAAGVLYVPGCSTLNEILQAERLGVELIKVFPASCLGGVDYIKALLAPCPWLKLMATGGVSSEPEELARWFDAGVKAVGLGSNVISGVKIKAGDFDGIADSIRRVEKTIRNTHTD